jgi:cellulose biosynthesis protein BcsQ
VTDESSIPAPRASTDSPVVTFYSYKGGVGRSMALANLAVVAAREYSLNVTVVDWDLEAPGLHRFFGVPDAEVRDGVIDYIHRYRKLVTDPPRNVTADDLRIDRSLITVRTFKGQARLSTVRLFAAGDLRDMSEYARKVQGIDWGRFYSDWNGAQLIESLRQQLKGSADLVLIDSRTGFTDIGGICTMQLPDSVVLVFTFNDQNLAGTERVANQLTEENEIFATLGRRPELFFLPSRKELSEIARLRDWEEKTADRLRKYSQSPRVQRQYPEFLAYIRKIATPYIPYFAFGEELAAETDKGLELVDAYQQLAALIVGREPLATVRREPGKAPATPHDRVCHRSRRRCVAGPLACHPASGMAGSVRKARGAGRKLEVAKRCVAADDDDRRGDRPRAAHQRPVSCRGVAARDDREFRRGRRRHPAAGVSRRSEGAGIPARGRGVESGGTAVPADGWSLRPIRDA